MNNSGAPATYTNPANTTLSGSKSAVWAQSGAVNLINLGTLQGNGSFPGDATNLPDGGVVISWEDSTVDNSGTISGNQFGITTSHYYNPSTMLQESRATNTVVTNRAGATITGQNNDGVRLIGGGTITNDGTIRGLAGDFTDGISAFPLDTQNHAAQPSLTTVTNNATGIVSGVRFGTILSGGGTVSNAGSMTGGLGGVLVQENTGTPTGKTGSITNSGTLTGTAGYGAGFAGTLTSTTMTNSGTVSGTTAGVAAGATGGLTLDNQAGGTITGSKIGVVADVGTLTLTNAGTIRGNGTVDSGQRDGGVNVGSVNSSITNSGTISGAGYGVVASAWISQTLGLQNTARNTSVTNLAGATIRGDNNDGVRLEGGGTVTNSGLIEGLAGAGADGVSMLAFSTQNLTGMPQIGTVDNKAGGTIKGNRLGVLLSGGGSVLNAGTIQGNGGAITLQEASLSGKTATVTNSGSLLGGTHAVTFAGTLASSSLTNSGTITGSNGYGVQNAAAGALTLANNAGGTITGSRSGVLAGTGAVTLTNAGTIRGNGTSDSTSDIPDGGVTVQAAGTAITNSGTISGAATGITTSGTFNATLNRVEGLALGTSVANSGTIRGDSNDGVRLIGGGSVTNSGLIEGLAGGGADGISMYQFDDQVRTGQSVIGSVTNSLGGQIKGNRFGVILSGGGTISNAGSVSGANGGITIQETAQSPGKTATITNSGSVTGSVFGLQMAGQAASGDYSNSGTVTATAGAGVANVSSGALTVRNLAGGTITGATIGVHGQFGTLTLVNAGTIRGNGTSDSPTEIPHGGVTVQTAGSTITNSGTISGAATGITTSGTFNATLNRVEGLALNTSVANSGTIRGASNDGVRLIGGGSVTNSGLIEGLVGSGADGISMYQFDDQVRTGQTGLGTVTNATGGEIKGNRFGVIISGGGTVANSGAVSGANGGIVIQETASLPGKTGSITNGGTVTGAAFGLQMAGQLATATYVNSGTVTATAGQGVNNLSSGTLTLKNLEGGRINGSTSGVYAGFGAIVLDNAGTIFGAGTADNLLVPPEAGVTLAAAGSSIVNSGTISGAGFGVTTSMQSEGTRLVGRAVNTGIVNSGTIRGVGNDAVRLIGGGSVANQGGVIDGRGNSFADGVSMFRFDDQNSSGQATIGSVTNAAASVIYGQRFGVILTGGGTVENAGSIGGGAGGVVIQQQTGDTNKSATLVNSGTITGTTQLWTKQYSLTNSGTLDGNVELGNGLETGAGRLVNSGRISGSVLFGGGDDFYDFVAGAEQVGTADGGAGTDTLTLLFRAQPQPQRLDGSKFINFEKLVQNQQGSIELFFSGATTFSGLGATDGGKVELGNGTVQNVAVGSGSTATVGANATVSTAEAGATAVAVSGSAGTVQSSGKIEATGTGSTAVALTGGTASFANSGTVAASGEGATAVQASGAATTVANAGAITTSGSNATAVNLSGSAAGVANTGAITTSGTGSTAVAVSGIAATISSAPGATITAAGNNSTAIAVSGSSATVANATGAVITTSGANSVGVAVAGADANVQNNGTLVATGDNSVGVAARGNRARISNTSLFTIRTTGANSDAIQIAGTGNSVSNTGAIRVSGSGSAGINVVAGAGSSNSIDNGAAGLIVSLDNAILAGDGDETVTNAGQITGNVRLGGGTDSFTLAEGGTVSGVIDGGAGTDSFTQAAGAAGATLASTTGFERFTKTGSGTLGVAQSAGFGEISVAEGRLQVAEGATLTGATTVAAGARLGGTGRIAGNVAVAGVLAPGNSIGTTTVAGNVSFAPGATYEVEVNGAGRSDLLVATGAATLGGSVSVLPEATNYDKLTSYSIVQAASVSGQFSGATVPAYPTLVPYLGYTATGVTLTLARSDLSFGSLATNSGQAGVAGIVQALGRGNALYDAVILRPTAAEGRAALSALTGEIHASLPTALLDESRLVRGALLGRAATPGEGYGLWGSAFGSRGESDRNGGAAEIDSERRGVIAGVEGSAAGFRLGLGAGISDSDMEVRERASSADVETRLVGAFAGWSGGGFTARLAGAYAWHDIDTARSIGIGGFTATPTARYDGSTAQVAGELGYALSTGVVGVEPFAGLAHVRTRTDGLAETAGAASVSVARQTREIDVATLGFRLTGEASLSSGSRFLPHLTAAYMRTWGDRQGAGTTRLGAAAAPFTVTGAALGRNGVVLDGGFDLAIGSALRIGASAGASLSDDFADHSAKLSVSFAF